jgi:predicted protein tyrosine phosphatase
VLALAAVPLINIGVSEVIPGQIVRSPQPTVDELRQLIEEYRLQTIISLRSTGEQHRWLREERALCDSLGVRHEAMSFNPDRWPARHQSVRLVQLLDNAPRPILLHCLRGIDRTGFASVTARLLAGHPVEEALAELSPRRGHICRRRLCPIHRVFGLYRSQLDRRREHSSANFRRWIIDDYCPPPYDAALELLDSPPLRAPAGASLRFRVRARNMGEASWRLNTGDRGVRLGARAIGPYEENPHHALAVFRNSNHLASDLARAGMHEDIVATGETRVFEISFPAPKQVGSYVIQLDMVDELVHWFSDLGWPGILFPLEVVSDPDPDPVPVPVPEETLVSTEEDPDSRQSPPPGARQRIG